MMNKKVLVGALVVIAGGVAARTARIIIKKRMENIKMETEEAE